MKLTIKYKGHTVALDGFQEITTDDVIKIIDKTIDKINQSCNNCTLEKPESYGVDKR